MPICSFSQFAFTLFLSISISLGPVCVSSLRRCWSESPHLFGNLVLRDREKNQNQWRRRTSPIKTLCSESSKRNPITRFIHIFLIDLIRIWMFCYWIWNLFIYFLLVDVLRLQCQKPYMGICNVWDLPLHRLLRCSSQPWSTHQFCPVFYFFVIFN